MATETAVYTPAYGIHYHFVRLDLDVSWCSTEPDILLLFWELLLFAPKKTPPQENPKWCTHL